MPIIAKYIPSFSFAIALSALTFQVFFLETWHHRLDLQLKSLKQNQEVNLQVSNESKIKDMIIISQSLEVLKKSLSEVDKELQKHTSIQ